MEAKVFVYLLIIMTADRELASGSCNRNDGPAGSPECVLLDPYYSKYRWATCLTNEYIHTVSKGNASCRDHSATYCYYQCMMESYQIAEGDVRDECACGVDAPQQTKAPMTNQFNLPSYCYSPSGKECNWYKDCLERRFPCERMQQTSYAINNGEKFCNLYEKHYNMFSNEGQQWIDAVRGCLQVSLVPLLRPFFEITCDEIKEKAFDSHVKCYSNPKENVPSFCDLTISDKLQILYTVIPGLMSNCYQHKHLCKDIFESAKQLWETYKACYFRDEILSTAANVKQIQLTYYGSNRLSKSRRPAQATDDFSAGADLINTIANKMEWEIEGVLWIAYFQNNVTADEHSLMQHLNFLLAPSNLYNLNDNTNISSLVNVMEIVEDVTRAFRNGWLTSDMINGISIVKYGECVDNLCLNTYAELQPLPSALCKNANDGFLLLSNIILISSVAFADTFIINYLYE